MSTMFRPKFGDWCTYDPNVFCQEPEGCKYCYIWISIKEDYLTIFSTGRA
jgi:hypothetical protein